MTDTHIYMSSIVGSRQERFGNLVILRSPGRLDLAICRGGFHLYRSALIRSVEDGRSSANPKQKYRANPNYHHLRVEPYHI